MKLGAMDYLLKPVTEEELRECLQNVREELDEEREQNVTEEIFRICDNRYFAYSIL